MSVYAGGTLTLAGQFVLCSLPISTNKQTLIEVFHEPQALDFNTN